jgi:hypothetical protein
MDMEQLQHKLVLVKKELNEAIAEEDSTGIQIWSNALNKLNEEIKKEKKQNNENII